MEAYRLKQVTDQNGTIVSAGIPDFEISLTGDTTLTAHYEPIPTYTFSVSTSPVNTPVLLDGVQVSTPYSAELEEGIHVLEAPLTVVDPVSGNIFKFDKWEDDSTSNVRTINLLGNSNVVAYYVEEQQPEPPVKLSVSSDPDDIIFKIQSTEVRTPFEGLFPVNSQLTIEMPPSVLVLGEEYVFSRWNDELTAPTRIILLTKDLLLKAYYVKKHVVSNQAENTLLITSAVTAIVSAATLATQ